MFQSDVCELHDHLIIFIGSVLEYILEKLKARCLRKTFELDEDSGRVYSETEVAIRLITRRVEQRPGLNPLILKRNLNPLKAQNLSLKDHLINEKIR